MTRVVPQALDRKAAKDGPPALDRVLDSREAAALLRCSVDTVLRLDIPFFVIGAGRLRPRRRYLESSVIEWARRHQAPGVTRRRRA